MSFKMKGSPMKRNFGVGDSPAKQTNTSIPSFRDFVSLEQQQSYADKLDKRRADEREYKGEIEEAGLDRNLFGKLTGDFFGGKRSRERADLIEKLKNKEEVVEEENIGEDGETPAGFYPQEEDYYTTNEVDPIIQGIEDYKTHSENMSNIVNEETIDEETVETTPYEVQGGDTLGEIAKANNMTLEELLEKNPEYKENPNLVRKGATLNL